MLKTIADKFIWVLHIKVIDKIKFERERSRGYQLVLKMSTIDIYLDVKGQI